MNPFLDLAFGLLEKAGRVAFEALKASGMAAEEQERLWNEKMGKLEFRAQQVESAQIIHPPKPVDPSSSPG
jgi:hypothetical protein